MAQTATVGVGMTLAEIAQQYGVSASELMSANPGVSATTLVPGNRLIVPSGKPVGNPPVGGGPVPVQRGAPGSTPGGDSAYQTLLSELNGMPGTERDAYAALETLFASYGLASLAPTILQYLQQGYGSDTITTLLQLTPQYQQRFAGNAARQKNGLQVLDPADYLSTEASYRQALVSAGIDPSFQTESQYAQWIGNDVSPDELNSRINLATAAVVNAPKQLTQAFSQLGINAGDLTGYFLNDNNPLPQLQQKLNQAQIMEAGLQSGLTVNPTSQNYAGQLAQEGVTYGQAVAGYQKVADVLPAANALSSIYSWAQPYNQQSAEQENLGGNGQAQLARENLGRQETAQFSGTSAAGQKSFAAQSAGTGF